jgi:hypothetical protein
MSRPKESSRSLYAISDTPATSGNQGENGLQRQAGQLLTDPKCNEAFAGRMSTGGVETTDVEIRQAAFCGKESMDALNTNTDQAEVAVKVNANADNLENLAKKDESLAVAAVMNDASLQTAGLNTGKASFNEKVRVALTGFGNA